MKIIKQIFEFGDDKYILETGGIARKATSSVIVRVKETVILVTLVAKKEISSDINFFPLNVYYQEKMYAGGIIPGGFLKREGRPTDHEILISRLIDRPIRPLFPKDFFHEIQIVATVLSSDPKIISDIPAMIGASAVCSLSGVPFLGPIGCARIGYINKKYVLNPNYKELEDSSLNLIVSGNKDSILMTEAESNQLSEEIILESIMHGHEQLQVVIQAINELVEVCGNPKWNWNPNLVDTKLVKKIKNIVKSHILDLYQIYEKNKRNIQITEIKNQFYQEYLKNIEIEGKEKKISELTIMNIFNQIESKYIRKKILNGGLRIDGRKNKTIRSIHIENGILPRVHGSSIFSRGETQAIVATTLGHERNAQIIDAMVGESKNRFLLHYNFPPYCVGEVGIIGVPKRREIGHANIAKRAFKFVFPNEKEFPYVIRVVSEITESDGSSSMATVCGASLSMMNAGIPIKSHVAGIAMGLIKQDNKFAILSDILGEEDYIGDMDFKVAGTELGITALQMDIKIPEGINKNIIYSALVQAKEGRIHILKLMNQVIKKSINLSRYAPRIYKMKVSTEKVREIIGKGGSTVRSITEETGANIDINDVGIVNIFSFNKIGAEKAINRIKEILMEPKIGKEYEGKISRVEDFGVFVTILPGKDGLLHISKIQDYNIDYKSYFLIGKKIFVRISSIDKKGRIKLTMNKKEIKGKKKKLEKKKI